MVKKTILTDNIKWYSIFATFNDFEIIRVFPKKHICFFKKKTNFERFEKSYYSSRVLQQIWYNLVKQIHVQKCERTSFFAWTQLADIGWKKNTIEWIILLSYIKQEGAN